MPSLEIIGGASFTQFASKALPVIPGLLAFGMFGSGSGAPGNDGINGNRVSGAAAFSVSGAAPAYANNFVTVGINGADATATAALTANAVTSLTVVTGGANYADPPGVVFSGGGGSGASATAVLTGGVLTGFTNLVGGSGYTSAPTVSFDGPPGSAINTNIVRTSGLLAAGWTWIAIGRTPTSGNPSTLISDVGATTVGLALTFAIQNADANIAGPAMLVSETGAGIVIEAPMASPSTNWKCVALTYAGGGAAALAAYNLTDALYPSPITSQAFVANAGRIARIGYVGKSTFHSQADVASVIIAQGALSLGALQAIYASLRAQEAQRGIIC